MADEPGIDEILENLELLLKEGNDDAISAKSVMDTDKAESNRTAKAAPSKNKLESPSDADNEHAEISIEDVLAEAVAAQKPLTDGTSEEKPEALVKHKAKQENNKEVKISQMESGDSNIETVNVEPINEPESSDPETSTLDHEDKDLTDETVQQAANDSKMTQTGRFILTENMMIDNPQVPLPLLSAEDAEVSENDDTAVTKPDIDMDALASAVTEDVLAQLNDHLQEILPQLVRTSLQKHVADDSNND